MPDYTKINIKNKISILNKIVLEVRYNYGYTYLDRCGKTVNAILSEFPEWTIKGNTPDPANAGLVSLRNECILNFSPLRYSFQLEQKAGDVPLTKENCQEFITQVALISNLLHDQLNLREFIRIGFRAFYFFYCASKNEAENWIKNLECFTISPNLINAFGTDTEGVGFAVFIVGEDRHYRVAFNIIERVAQLDLGSEILNVQVSKLAKDQRKYMLQKMQARQKMRANPEQAAMIDIDSYIEDPISIDPPRFVETSIERFASNLLAGIS